MKIVKILAAVAIAAVISSAANASVVNFNGPNVNMGTLANGQTGNITDNFTSSSVGSYKFENGSDFGFLGSDSSITFTYSFADILANSMHAYGSYSYTSGSNTYTGSSSSYSDGSTVNVGSTNGVSSAPLVFASANLTPNLRTGTVTITNTSSSLAQIQSLFSALFSTNGRVVSVTYAVSAVPLPAAFPLFAAVLAGLIGFSYYRKRRSV